jgi:hypothetical protein
MSKEMEYYQKVIKANQPIFISKKKIIKYLEKLKEKQTKPRTLAIASLLLCAVFYSRI